MSLQKIERNSSRPFTTHSYLAMTTLNVMSKNEKISTLKWREKKHISSEWFQVSFWSETDNYCYCIMGSSTYTCMWYEQVFSWRGGSVDYIDDDDDGKLYAHIILWYKRRRIDLKIKVLKLVRDFSIRELSISRLCHA